MKLRRYYLSNLVVWNICFTTKQEEVRITLIAFFVYDLVQTIFQFVSADFVLDACCIDSSIYFVLWCGVWVWDKRRTAVYAVYVEVRLDQETSCNPCTTNLTTIHIHAIDTVLGR